MFSRFFVAAAGLALTAPVAAETHGLDQPNQAMVAYYDLDLTKQDDVDALDRRINRAAARVCEIPTSTKELRRFRLAKRCMTETVARSDQQVAQVILVAKERKEGSYQVARK